MRIDLCIKNRYLDFMFKSRRLRDINRRNRGLENRRFGNIGFSHRDNRYGRGLNYGCVWRGRSGDIRGFFNRRSRFRTGRRCRCGRLWCSSFRSSLFTRPSFGGRFGMANLTAQAGRTADLSQVGQNFVIFDGARRVVAQRGNGRGQFVSGGGTTGKVVVNIFRLDFRRECLHRSIGEDGFFFGSS